MVYKRSIKPNYWLISKEKIEGKYIATPYTSKPKAMRGHIIVSGKKHHYPIRKEYGFAELKTLPTDTLKKPKPRSRGFDFGFAHF